MELREPRRKRRVPVKCQQPFPLPIQNFTEEVIFKGVRRTYTGQYTGSNVIVKNPEDITALYSMGFFGKGSLSRGAPTFGKWKMDTPPLIYNRQWKRRCEWAKTCKNSPTSCGEIVSVSAGDDTSGNLKEKEDINSDVAVKKIKTEVVQIDDDDEVMIEQVKTEAAHSSKEKKDSSSAAIEPASQNSVQCKPGTEAQAVGVTNNDSSEVDLKQGQSVIVLADSNCDSGDEDYLLNLNPKLEQEEFPIQETLQLTLEEAFFLSYGLGCLQILDMLGNELSILELWKLFHQSQTDFVEKYVVYHYFRSKGWIVKPGIKFGGDFLLYKQGPAFYHASYIVHVDVLLPSEMGGPQSKRALSWTQYIGLNRLAETAGKEILLCNVLWPPNVSRTEICNSLKVLEKFTVQEVLLRRWVSSQEREELENEEIMN